MNRITSRLSVALGALVLAAGILSAEPAPFPAPVQAYGGQGGARNRLLDDAELTAITKVELAFRKQIADVQDARNALTASSLTNRADINAKAQALATAELTLATSRATAYQQLKGTMKSPTPAKLAALARELGGPAPAGAAGAAGGRGGGAAAPGPAAAPAPRGM